MSDGDATHDRVCEPCSSAYSTTTNATSCTPWTDCGAGTYVSASGTWTADRTCTDCPLGTFNAASSNVSICTAWRECAFDEDENTPGTALADRTCASAGTTLQFGTSDSDEALAVSAGDFHLAVGGRTNAALPQATFNGGWDAFVQLYSSRSGLLQWTRQFGTQFDDEVTSVGLTQGGGVFVTGRAGTTDAGGPAHCLRYYSSTGDVVWTVETPWPTAAVSVGSDNSVVVVGSVTGTLPGQDSSGNQDAVVQKYSSAGALLWTRQFGSSEADRAVSVSVGLGDTVVVAGITFGVFPGQTHVGEQDIFVQKYDAAGALLWTRQFGSAEHDSATAVSVTPGGAGIAVAGFTTGTLPGQTNHGLTDAFVRWYDAVGNVLQTRQFGGASHDLAYAVSRAPDGRVLVAGSTDGALADQSSLGGLDAFLVTYDGAGALVRTRQFGSFTADRALGVSTDIYGVALVVGVVGSALPGRVALGGSDAFLRTINNP